MKINSVLLCFILNITSVFASDLDSLYSSLRSSLGKVEENSQAYSSRAVNEAAYNKLRDSDPNFRQFVVTLAFTDKAWSGSNYAKAKLYGPKNRIQTLAKQARVALERLHPTSCSQDSLVIHTGACFGFLTKGLSLAQSDKENIWYRRGIYLEGGKRYQRKFDENFEIQTEELPMPKERDTGDVAIRYFVELQIQGARALENYDEGTVVLGHKASFKLLRMAIDGPEEISEIEQQWFFNPISECARPKKDVPESSGFGRFSIIGH